MNSIDFGDQGYRQQDSPISNLPVLASLAKKDKNCHSVADQDPTRCPRIYIKSEKENNLFKIFNMYSSQK